jgi:hypothetical protein
LTLLGKTLLPALNIFCGARGVYFRVLLWPLRLLLVRSRNDPETSMRARAGHGMRPEINSVSTACLETQRKVRTKRNLREDWSSLIADGRTAGRQAHRGGLRSAWHSKKGKSCFRSSIYPQL